MPHDRNQDLSELHRWLDVVAPELAVSPADVPVGDILDMAKAVAHEVTRPGVPVTAFLAGLAVGRGGTAEEVLAELTRQAEAWPNPASDRTTVSR